MLRDFETTILPQFQLIIEAAEKSSEHRQELEIWLKKLRDALYETANMVDLYDHQLLKDTTLKKLVRKLTTGVKQRRSLISKFEKISFDQGNTFHELCSRQPNVTTSLCPQRVYGRDTETDEIIDKYLLSKRGSPVVAVVGAPGAGKTTIAQLVYNDRRVVEHFVIRVWVCMASKLDIFRHTREMIECASKNECPILENLDTLQRTLIDIIRSKKVFVVFDDVWCDESVNEVEWERFITPLLAFGNKESKILVTTRTKNMPAVLRPEKIVQLKDLGEEDIYSLFMHHAFGGRRLDDRYLQEELEKVGRQIVQKLGKSPSMAKVVGGQLSKRLKVDAWRAALERENLDNITQDLLWSYQHLDAAMLLLFQSLS